MIELKRWLMRIGTALRRPIRGCHSRAERKLIDSAVLRQLNDKFGGFAGSQEQYVARLAQIEEIEMRAAANVKDPCWRASYRRWLRYFASDTHRHMREDRRWDEVKAVLRGAPLDIRP